MSATRDRLVAALLEARAATEALLGALAEPVLRAQYHSDFSPVGWHLGHIAAFEEHWLLVRAHGADALSPDYSALFSPVVTPKQARSAQLPSAAQLWSYAREVRGRVLDALARADLLSDASGHPLLAGGRIVDTIVAHEHQHVETMAYVLAAAGLLGEGRAGARPGGAHWAPRRSAPIEIPGGAFVMGTPPGAREGYDNERDAHEVALAPYSLETCAATNADYAAFVEDGGYARRALWSEAGWAWLAREPRRGPRYWGPEPLAYARARLDPAHPVERLAWYEADAYARWAGGRLPTEAEWERAARWDAAAGAARAFPWGEREPDARLAAFDRRAEGPDRVDARPEGASPVGCLGMAGGVWEWTATAFAPYPRFSPWPYAGYSVPYFDGAHFVMRGGSWASRRTAVRAAFRNWYTAGTCEVFAGVRVARDAG